MESIITLPVTSWTAAICALLFLALTWSVIAKRRQLGIVLGDGDDRVTTKRIRGQANAAEQIPITLIILGLAELQGAPQIGLAAAAALFVIGRTSHAAYFARHGLHWRFRAHGMLATLVAQGVIIAMLIVALIT